MNQSNLYQENLQLWQHYLANAKLSGDRYSEAVAVTNLGAIYDALEQYNEALESYHQGLVISREMGDRSKEIWVLNNIGTTYNTLAQYDKAVEAYQSAVAIEMPLGASLLLMLPLQISRSGLDSRSLTSDSALFSL